MAHSRIDGSCGRRPMMTTSNASTATVMPIVSDQARVDTSTKLAPPVDNSQTPEVSPVASGSKPRRPAAPDRSWSDRDDDVTAKEYSPPAPSSCQAELGSAKPTRVASKA